MSSPSQQAAWQRSQSNLQSSASYAITVYKRQNDLDSRITNAITSARDARAKAERIRQRSPERQFTSTSRDACDPYGFYPVASAASQYEERHRYPRSSNSPEQVSQTFREQLLYAQGCLSDAQALKDLRSHLDTVNGQFAIHSGRILTAMGHSNIHEDPASIVTTWLSIPDTSNPRREVALYFPNNSVQVTPQATPQVSPFVFVVVVRTADL